MARVQGSGLWPKTSPPRSPRVLLRLLDEALQLRSLATTFREEYHRYVRKLAERTRRDPAGSTRPRCERIGFTSRTCSALGFVDALVHCPPAGSGENVVRRLVRYVRHTAISDERSMRLGEDKVMFHYTDSTTQQNRICPPAATEFRRRYLQHVPPPGLHRGRYFGWMHPTAKKRRLLVETLLAVPALSRLRPCARRHSAATCSGSARLPRMRPMRCLPPLCFLRFAVRSASHGFAVECRCVWKFLVAAARSGFGPSFVNEPVRRCRLRRSHRAARHKNRADSDCAFQDAAAKRTSTGRTFRD